MTEPRRTGLIEAVERVGDRWSLLIVDALLDRPLRFSDLQERVEGIAPNTLSARLRQLEAEAIVMAVPYQARPRRYTYDLTAAGRELAGALRLLAHWGAAHSEHAEPVRHSACGTAVEARWYCPTCDRAMEDPEASDLSFL